MTKILGPVVLALMLSACFEEQRIEGAAADCELPSADGRVVAVLKNGRAYCMMAVLDVPKGDQAVIIDNLETGVTDTVTVDGIDYTPVRMPGYEGPGFPGWSPVLAIEADD